MSSKLMHKSLPQSSLLLSASERLFVCAFPLRVGGNLAKLSRSLLAWRLGMGGGARAKRLGGILFSRGFDVASGGGVDEVDKCGC